MNNPTICFGYRTAFHLLRSMDLRSRSALRRSACTLPDRTPSTREITATIERLQEAYPGIGVELPAHILVSNPTLQRRPVANRITHVCSTKLPTRSTYHLGGGAFACIPALAFTQAATQEKSMIDLLRLGFELCGTYQTRRTGLQPAYQVEPLTSMRALGSFAACNPSLRGSKKVTGAMRYLAEGSASPRETQNALVLGMPMGYGGYSLGIPRMNYKVEATPAARALTGKSSFRCDLCWPDAKLDVEYQSREHHSGETKRIEDSRRTNALQAMGWTVVCMTNNELDSLVATDAIAEAIRQRLGKRLAVRVSDYHARKLRLRRHLGLPVDCCR